MSGLIIFAAGADVDDEVDAGLVKLTKAIAALEEERVAHGFLGGEYGYGADFENDVFLMHPYCWCERDDCPWCAGCHCGDNYWCADPVTEPGIKCDWCSGVHRFADKGALPPDEPPHQAAPNFWHKSSGARVWWYKYIGRGMDVVMPDGADFTDIIKECIASLKADRRALEGDGQ